jgi:hypothetical protein
MFYARVILLPVVRRMRTYIVSFFWGNVIIFAEVIKWLAAKEILKGFSK